MNLLTDIAVYLIAGFILLAFIAALVGAFAFPALAWFGAIFRNPKGPLSH